MDHVSAIDAMGDSSPLGDANYMAGGHDTAPAPAPPASKKKDRTLLYIFGGAAAAFVAYAGYSTLSAKHASPDAGMAPPPAASQPAAPLVPPMAQAPVASPMAPQPAAAPIAPAAPATPAGPQAGAASGQDGDSQWANASGKADAAKPAPVAKSSPDTKPVPVAKSAPQSTIKVESPTAAATTDQAAGSDSRLDTRMDKLEKRVGRIEVAVNKIARVMHIGGKGRAHKKAAHGKHAHKGKAEASTKSAGKSATTDSAMKVQAVTPGRVWIVDNKGATHSLTTGDKLPNGAVIKGIDADSGVIETSKGNIK